jgi:uncharacterized protein involved in exopolysaccharide biosynthesis
MNNERKLTFADYLVYIVKHRRFLFITLSLTAVLGYLTIFFLVEEQFDSTSVIIPAEDEGLGGISSLLGDIGNLPLDIAGGFSSEEMGMYNTIIYSRTLLEKVIGKFNLIDIYKLSLDDPEYMERALKILRGNISTNATEDMSYVINVRAPNPDLSAEMNNYIIAEMNKKIVELKIEKSRNNRRFLAKRVEEIETNLKFSEDSLMYFQENTGLLEAEEQIKQILGAYTELETSLITKQIEKSILEKIYHKNSPQVERIQIEVEEYNQKLKKLKSSGQENSILLSMESLPKNAINYFRNFRNVEINTAILEFVLPLYEQAKFEEQKDVPVLQIVDNAVPPAKKSFPPRLVFTILLTFGSFIICFFFILIRENENWQNSEKYIYVRKNLFKWKDIR